jgi:short-subunit dehydrogenase
VASLAAIFPTPFMSVYGSSKAFLLGFSLALHQELLGSPVSVSVLCPNVLRTRPACQVSAEQLGVFEGLFCVDVARVAELAVRCTLAREAIIVPGLFNRMLAGLSRLLPRATVLSLAATVCGKTARL